MGLFLGVELVRDGEKQTPAVDEAASIVEMMKDRGILLSVDGLYHNVLKIKPPLVITRADVSRFIREFDNILEHL
jgi:ethanolamine-phosphate phospho-lyase